MKRILKHGGPLERGDFIAISIGNSMDFGWYCGDGQNTLQYYHYEGPKLGKEHFDRTLIRVNNGEKVAVSTLEKIRKGFSLKWLYKYYIISIHSSRVIKIINPETLFTEKEDLEKYEKSKEALMDLNFIKN